MLFISFLFLAIAFAAPLDLSLDLDTFQNLTAVDRCSNSLAWQAHAFLVEDCFRAVQRIYIEEVLKKPNLEMYEFVADGAYPRTEHPWLRTPVQYTENSCVLSILVLDWIKAWGPLPGRGPEGHERSDTANFRDIYAAARVVERDCLLPSRGPGWEIAGSKSSIGVFLWATDSSINKQITGRGEILLNNGLPNVLSPNASSNFSDKIESTD